MSKHGRHEEEPYTFDPKEDAALKESVAAHQAECGCHPAELTATATSCGPHILAHDSSGQPWHIDPLCKVRPEAKA